MLLLEEKLQKGTAVPIFRSLVPCFCYFSTLPFIFETFFLTLALPDYQETCHSSVVTLLGFFRELCIAYRSDVLLAIKRTAGLTYVF